MKKHLLTLSAVLTALVCSTATFTSCGNDDDDDDNNNDSNPSQTVDKKENVIIYNNDTVYVNKEVVNAAEAIKGYAEYIVTDMNGKQVHKETFNQIMSEWSTCSILFDPNYDPYQSSLFPSNPDHLKINIGTIQNPIKVGKYAYYHAEEHNAIKLESEESTGFATPIIPLGWTESLNDGIDWGYGYDYNVNTVTKVDEIGTLKNGNKLIAITGLVDNLTLEDHWGNEPDIKMYAAISYHLVGILR